MAGCSLDPLIRHLCVVIANMEDELEGLRDEQRQDRVLVLGEERDTLQKEVEELRAKVKTLSAQIEWFVKFNQSCQEYEASQGPTPEVKE